MHTKCQVIFISIVMINRKCTYVFYVGVKNVIPLFGRTKFSIGSPALRTRMYGWIVAEIRRFVIPLRTYNKLPVS